MESLIKKTSGLGLVLGIAYVAKVTSDWLSPWLTLEAMTLAIFMSIALSPLFRKSKHVQWGARFSLKKLLNWGIILMGTKLSFQMVADLGLRGSVSILIFVPFVMGLSWVVGRLLKIPEKLALLLGVGSAICGASAIVAMAPLMKAKEKDMVLSVSVISLLGALGVMGYSLIVQVLPFDLMTYGMWSGLTLQGVAHALAAAFAMGDLAGAYGTLVKMTRVLTLIPMALILSMVFKSEDEALPIPYYVFGFIGVAVVTNMQILPQGVIQVIQTLSSWLIIMAMVGMGLQVNFQHVKEEGTHAMRAGLLLFLLVSLSGLLWVRIIL